MTNDPQQLDRSLVQGIAWVGGVRWMTQIVSWAITFVVARFLLTPADYGVFGMAMVYIGLVQFIGEAGLSAVIIKPPELDDDHAARLGGLGVMLGIALFCFSAIVAGLIAMFFHKEVVRWFVTVLGVTFVLRGIQVLPRGLLARELNYARLAWIDGCETLGLTLGTLILALCGLHSWALAFGVVIGVSVSTTACLLWRPHRITFRGDLRELRGSTTLGAEVGMSQVAWYFYSNADFMVVGRLLGEAALGAYTLGWTFASIPVDRVTALIGRVTPAVFAAVQDDPAALRRYLCNLTEGIALIAMPACVGLALVGDVLVPVALGPAWHAAIVPLRLLALYAAFRCIVTLLPQVLVYTGHARRSMQFSVLNALILPGLFYGGAHWGTTGVAIVWITAYPLLMSVGYVRFALKSLGLPVRTYLHSLWPAVSASLAMAAVVGALRLTLPDSLLPVGQLAVLCTSGAVVYCGLIWALHRRRVEGLLRLLKTRDAAIAAASPSVRYTSAARPDRARLLLISYHFPPDPAIGSLRWEKFARFAAERGWALDVISGDPLTLQAKDRSRLTQLPAGVRVYGVPLPSLRLDRWTDAAARLAARVSARTVAPRAPSRPRQCASLSRAEIMASRRPRDLVRAWFGWLEYRRGRRWAEAAARVGDALLSQGTHRAVISCGPPHFAHAAAAAAASRARVPFMMDLRDPWSLVQRLPESVASPLVLAVAARDERRMVEGASLIVANTEPFRRAMAERYPAAADRIVAIPNGFDDDPLPAPVRSARFVAAYAGTVYLDRDPRPLFRALAMAIRRLGVSPSEFSVEFMGDVAVYEGVPLDAIARAEGVDQYVRLHAVRPRHEALEFLAGASMLILLPQDSDLAIPGKVYEYMRFDAWILVLAAVGSATELLLRGTDADVVAPGDDAALAEAIVRRYRQHRGGATGVRLSRHEHFSRRSRAAAMFAAIERVAGSPPGTEAPDGLEQERRGVAQAPDLLAVVPAADAEEVASGT